MGTALTYRIWGALLLCMPSGIYATGSASQQLLPENYEMQWQAAYQLRDAKAANRLADRMIEQAKLSNEKVTARIYKIRSRCLEGDPQQAWKELRLLRSSLNSGASSLASSQARDESLATSQISPQELEAIGAVAWSFLRSQLQTATPETWLFVCSHISAIHERAVTDLVLLALQQTDLRVQLAALSLVASYPQDVYRGELVRLWQSAPHPLLRARLLEITSELGWKEAQAMAVQMSQAPQLSRMELVALAQYEMLKQKFSPQLIYEYARDKDPLKKRLGAWMLRFCPVDNSELPSIYAQLLPSSDPFTYQLALDSLSASHMARLPALRDSLKQLEAKSTGSGALQIQCLLASMGGRKAIGDLWQMSAKHWKEGQQLRLNETWQLSQATAWLVSCACRDPLLLTQPWQERESYPLSCRLQLAQGVLFTRSALPRPMVEQAASLIEGWLKQSEDLWLQDTLWLSQRALSEQPPGWMPAVLVHQSAGELRWQMLELLSLVKPKSSFQIAWNLSRSMPQQWNLPMLWLAWSLGEEAFDADLSSSRDRRWLKATLLASLEDKQLLKDEWGQAEPWWRERIMVSLMKQADGADLPFLIEALADSGEIRIKTCCAILVALRQGYRIVK